MGAVELLADDGIDTLVVTEYFAGNEQAGDRFAVFKLLLLPEFAANGQEYTKFFTGFQIGLAEWGLWCHLLDTKIIAFRPGTQR